jgi:hypothetical protein
MPVLGYCFLNATNFISRPAIRANLLNLHIRERAPQLQHKASVLQNQSRKAAVIGNPIRKRLVRFRYEESRAVIGHSSHMGSKTYLFGCTEATTLLRTSPMLLKMKLRRNMLFLSSRRRVKMNPSPPSHHMYFKTILAFSSHLRLIRARGLFVSSFPAKSLYNALLFFLTNTTC